MSPVKVGQIWDFVGEHTDAPPDALGWRCIVVKANDSREAGPDSWEMRCLDWTAGYRGKQLYMHRKARLTGQWRRVSWWRQLRDWFWAGERLDRHGSQNKSESKKGTEKP